MKTLQIFVVISAVAAICLADFYITTAPPKMEFAVEAEQKVIKRRELPSVINFLMGMPAKYLHRTESWEGVKSIDVFHPPKANLLVTIHLPSENSFSLSKYIVKYETDNHDLSVPPIFELNSAIISRYEDRSLVKALVLEDQYKDDRDFHDTRIDLRRIRKQLKTDQSVLLTLPPESLSDINSDLDADLLFLGEMQMMKNFLDDLNHEIAIHRTCSYHVMLSSVDRLSETYGADSKQVKEAVAVLQYYIPHFIDATNAHFHGQLLSEVEINEGEPTVSDYLVRHARSLMQAAPAAGEVSNSTLLNLAEPNSDEFGIIFNIVLWFMIGFTLVAVAATYVMWFMDPGKDNIIYRVTSQRVKIN